ncbi:hypothetical protein COO91_04179 [Nostoc flagelliforme CCNUN1]|uniref:Uncharacterized protein n=1 Tax=Nostoc flagelliforme CCNUN1 TaxID=2038116 RepID=A0A2K8SRV3_9NOSO|nr:hypothetical protein COO91_04179 [Nostoc flagelliforme CCNUN1]
MYDQGGQDAHPTIILKKILVQIEDATAYTYNGRILDAQIWRQFRIISIGC